MIFREERQLVGILGLARLAHAGFVVTAERREMRLRKRVKKKSRGFRLARLIVSHASNRTRLLGVVTYRG
jgi:hypothetical protein